MGFFYFFFVRSLAPTRLLEKYALIIGVFQRALEAAAIANKASKNPEGTDSQLRGAAFKYKPHSSSNRRSTFLRVLFINHSFLTRYKPFPPLAMLHVAAVPGEEGSAVEFFKKMSAEDSLVFDSVSAKLTSAMV